MNLLLDREYNLDQIEDVADEIFKLIRSEKIWLMNGQMGAGKTTLTQCLLKRLSQDEFKGSPTFSLVNVYNKVSSGGKVYHFDLYRLNSLEEAWDIGVEDMWRDQNSISIIEWSEKATEILPQKTVSLNIEFINPSLRRITIKKDY